MISENIQKILRLTTLGLIVLSTSMFSVAVSKDAVVVRDSDLKNEAKSRSATILTLKKDSNVSVGERQGGWYLVTFNNERGWLKFVSVRFSNKAQQGSSGISETAQLLTQGSKPALTAGVKGMQEEDLTNAKADLMAVDQMQEFLVSAGQAENFAEQASLK
jgi:uncharacterized protein YgiM (DUF1202 family)